MTKIPEYVKYCGEKKIAILDNSSLEFLLELKNKGIETIPVLMEYEVVLVPEWVYSEVSHSEARIGLLGAMCDHGVHIYRIDETNYSNFLGYRDLNLYEIVLAAAGKLGELKSYIRRNIGKEDPADMDDSAEWMRKLYDEWPIGNNSLTEKGGIKKNAGDVSITILAEIFSWYYSDLENVTIYSQDRDTYEFEREATNLLYRSIKKMSPLSITYKSNDAILLQLFRADRINEQQIRDIRKNARVMNYTEVKSDKSVALVEKIVNTDEFVHMMRNTDVQIIF